MINRLIRVILSVGGSFAISIFSAWLACLLLFFVLHFTGNKLPKMMMGVLLDQFVFFAIPVGIWGGRRLHAILQRRGFPRDRSLK
jgi:prolipoprotein diacylglyceryltransferase